MTIAYLVSEFPKTSETFVSREVLTLANLGLPVKLFGFRSLSPLELGNLDDDPTRNQFNKSQPGGHAVDHLFQLLNRLPFPSRARRFRLASKRGLVMAGRLLNKQR
jgi:hypothetical protein